MVVAVALIGLRALQPDGFPELLLILWCRKMNNSNVLQKVLPILDMVAIYLGTKWANMGFAESGDISVRFKVAAKNVATKRTARLKIRNFRISFANISLLNFGSGSPEAESRYPFSFKYGYFFRPIAFGNIKICRF